ncbi:uncharacterized protein [Oryctolagus cuniculus]|uniref:uncharacterized protein n=1 Tax=Oryctolagus cuniculus TaxID=9986 RepID=UPI00387A1333
MQSDHRPPAKKKRLQIARPLNPSDRHDVPSAPRFSHSISCPASPRPLAGPEHSRAANPLRPATWLQPRAGWPPARTCPRRAPPPRPPPARPAGQSAAAAQPRRPATPSRGPDLGVAPGPGSQSAALPAGPRRHPGRPGTRPPSGVEKDARAAPARPHSPRRCGGGDDDDGLDLSDQRTPARDGLGREAGGGGVRRGASAAESCSFAGLSRSAPRLRRLPRAALPLARSARLGLARPASPQPALPADAAQPPEPPTSLPPGARRGGGARAPRRLPVPRRTGRWGRGPARERSHRRAGLSRRCSPDSAFMEPFGNALLLRSRAGVQGASSRSFTTWKPPPPTRSHAPPPESPPPAPTTTPGVPRAPAHARFAVTSGQRPGRWTCGGRSAGTRAASLPYSRGLDSAVFAVPEPPSPAPRNGPRYPHTSSGACPALPSLEPSGRTLYSPPPPSAPVLKDPLRPRPAPFRGVGPSVPYPLPPAPSWMLLSTPTPGCGPCHCPSSRFRPPPPPPGCRGSVSFPRGERWSPPWRAWRWPLGPCPASCHLLSILQRASLVLELLADNIICVSLLTFGFSTRSN